MCVAHRYYARPTILDSDWLTLDLSWNKSLKNNFESYLEIRPVALDELRTRISSEIDCSLGLGENTAWWSTFATDLQFHIEPTPQRRISDDVKINIFTSPESISTISANSTSETPTFRLTKEALESHESRLSRSYSSPLDAKFVASKVATKKKQSTTPPKTGSRVSLTVTPGGGDLSATMRNSSSPDLRKARLGSQSPLDETRSNLSHLSAISFQKRQTLYASLHGREERRMSATQLQPPSPQETWEPVVIQSMTWDDTPEKDEMEWEKKLPIQDHIEVDPDEPVVLNESIDIDAITSISPNLHALNLQSEATSIAEKAGWDSKKNFAPKFVEKDSRAHVIEGLLIVFIL